MATRPPSQQYADMSATPPPDYDYAEIWGAPGSAGVVNPADIGKVTTEGSIIQLIGISEGIVAKAPQATERIIGGETVEATIYYNVTPTDGMWTAQEDLALKPPPASAVSDGYLVVRFRSGSGRIRAEFIKTNIVTGEEDTIVSFDSKLFQSDGGVDPDLWITSGFYSEWQGVIDFVRNVYYVKVVLSAMTRPETPIYNPPMLQSVQLHNILSYQDLENNPSPDWG